MASDEDQQGPANTPGLSFHTKVFYAAIEIEIENSDGNASCSILRTRNRRGATVCSLTVSVNASHFAARVAYERLHDVTQRSEHSKWSDGRQLISQDS